jgi:GxxExxY protein
MTRLTHEIPDTPHVNYKGRRLGRAYLIDGVVNRVLALEIKVVDAILPVHVAQAITYVRLAHVPAGLLINFNSKRLVDGVRRILNDRPSPRPSVTSELRIGGKETSDGGNF